MGSIRTRLFLLVFAAVAFSVAGLALFSRQVVQHEVRTYVGRQPASGLAAAARSLAPRVADGTGGLGAALGQLAPMTGHALLLLDREGHVLDASLPALRATAGAWSSDSTLRLRGPAGIALELHRPERAPVLDPAGRTLAWLVALPDRAGQSPPEPVGLLHRLDRRLALGAAAALLLGLALAWVLAHHIVQPVAELALAAHRVADGDLTARVRVRGDDELAGLARRFNVMTAALAAQAVRRRQLTSDVAHELRTPLAHLRARLEAMQDGLAAVDGAALATLHGEVLHLARLVEDLEQMAAADAGALALELGPVSADEALGDAARAVEAAFAARAVPLRIEPAPGLAVHADRGRLAQILRNLLDNALTHSTAGQEVVLRGRATGDAVELVVEDHGEGIAPADRERVFERFWRADPSRARATGGTGLGLAIVKHLVEAQGGRVALASQPGSGTTVTVTLPRA